MNIGAHITSLSLLVVCLAGCATDAAATLAQWVQTHGSRGQKPQCALEVSGEYFFLFKSGNDVRIGSRIDMTDYPAASLVAWRFRDERGRDLTAKKPPIVLRSESIRVGSTLYGESVELQTLRDDDPESIEVTAHVKKCRSFECDYRITREKDEASYVVRVCTLKLRP